MPLLACRRCRPPPSPFPARLVLRTASSVWAGPQWPLHACCDHSRRGLVPPVWLFGCLCGLLVVLPVCSVVVCFVGCLFRMNIVVRVSCLFSRASLRALACALFCSCHTIRGVAVDRPILKVVLYQFPYSSTLSCFRYSHVLFASIFCCRCYC